MGMRVMAYMDDLFIVSQSKVEAKQVAELTQQVLKSLAWVINTKKSSLLPSQVTEFLSVLVDTTDMPKFRVPPSKAHALHHNIKHLLHLHDREGKVPVCHLATIVGQGVVMTKAVLLAKLLLCNVHCMIATQKSWNDQVQLLTTAVQDLKEWLHGLLLWDRNLTHLHPHDVSIDTDTSLTGWGATLSQLSLMATSWWRRQDRHINEYEMRAILKALRTFGPHLTGKSILV
jgi:hypothetical protein